MEGCCPSPSHSRLALRNKKEASRTQLQRSPFLQKAMMTSKATPTKKRDRLRRWRNLLSSSSETDANQADSISSSPSTSELFAPKPTMSPPSVVSDCSSFQTQSSNSRAYSTTPAANVPGRDFLNKALQLLSEQERATILEHILPTVEDIDSMLLCAFNAAKDKQRLCENKRWAFTIRGHTVRLGDEADKVVRWLDRFKQVGDIAANADAIHAGFPWAAIRFLLEVQNISLNFLPPPFGDFQTTVPLLTFHRQLYLKAAK